MLRSIVDCHARNEKERQTEGCCGLELQEISDADDGTHHRLLGRWGRHRIPPPSRQISDAADCCKTNRPDERGSSRAGVESELEQSGSPNAPSSNNC